MTDIEIDNETEEVEAVEETPVETEEETVATVSKAEFDDMRTKLKGALEKERAAKKDLERQVAPEEGSAEANEALMARTNSLESALVAQAATAQLIAAGLSTDPARFVKLLDMDIITVNDDGSVDGIEEQVLEISRDYSDLFKKAAPAPAEAKRDTVAVEKPMSASERQAQMVLGN